MTEANGSSVATEPQTAVPPSAATLAPAPAPPSQPVSPDLAFAYRAETEDGHALSGTIDAPGLEDARRQLESLRLRILAIEPAARPSQPKPLSGEDFLAFNQQLAHLTAAGLPVEYGLRLIAQDMASGRLARTVSLIADELDRGGDLAEAFEKHRGRFPSFYGQMIRAGVKANNLSAILFGLGRYGELVQRLRGMLWRTVAYPLMVFVAMCLVLIFLGMVVLPQFRQIYQDFKVELPGLTNALMAVSFLLPYVLIAALALLVAAPLGWQLLRPMGWDRVVVDRVVARLPLIGPILRWNLVARWCDALRLGVEAGLDLPEAIQLAGDATSSPALRRDGQRLIGILERGQALPKDATVVRGNLLPATVPAAIQLGSERHDLPTVLRSLVEMYQQQAEYRMGLVPTVLLPLLLLLMSAMVGVIIAAVLLPLLQLIQTVSGGGSW